VTADLLRRVEITMNDLPVRAYELAYTTGAFNKTLLNSITEFGADNQPFTSQTFSYYNDIQNSSGQYQAFFPVGWDSPDRQPAQRGGGRGRLGRPAAGVNTLSGRPSRHVGQRRAGRCPGSRRSRP